MSRRPFISVIIPHLNQPKGLHRCLESLARQSYPRESFEVIVVDNGSADSPADIVATLDRAHLEYESEPGPGPARNRGAVTSTGEILAFIDADCIAHEGWLGAIAKALTCPGAASIVGGDVRIAIADPARPTWLEAYECVFAYRQRNYIECKGFSGTGNLAVRRSTYEEVGPFAGPMIAEDRDWGRRAREIGLEITYVRDMIVFHPARTSLHDLQIKWLRQHSHDLEEWKRDGRSSLAWLARAIAVAGSPVRDVPRALLSDRIVGARIRVRAAIVLLYIRWFRAWHMISLLAGKMPNEPALFWNRS